MSRSRPVRSAAESVMTVNAEAVAAATETDALRLIGPSMC